MFIFDRCCRSSAAVTPVKYECDSNNITGAFARSKILLTEKLTNGALVTPTPGQCPFFSSYSSCPHICTFFLTWDALYLHKPIRDQQLKRDFFQQESLCHSSPLLTTCNLWIFVIVLFICSTLRPRQNGLQTLPSNLVWKLSFFHANFTEMCSHHNVWKVFFWLIRQYVLWFWEKSSDILKKNRHTFQFKC